MKWMIIQSAAMTLFGALLIAFVYSRFVEKRSLQSWMAERLLGLVSAKRQMQTTDEAKQQKALAALSNSNEKPFSLPKLPFRVEEQQIEGMQVFVWNDRQDPQQRVILYLHGGAYVAQPLPFHFIGVEEMARELDARVVFPIYPKLPHYTYREVFPKLEGLYRRVLQETDPAFLTLMGDSAGGGMALALAMHVRNQGLPQPKDIILLSPWLDIHTDHPDIEKYADKDPMLYAPALRGLGTIWAGGSQYTDSWYVSPLFGDFHHLGRISLFVGTHEIFLPDCEKLHHMLTEQGIAHHYYEADKMNHVYVLYPIPEAKKDRENIVNRIREA